MGFDVYGVAPTSEKGRYFRNNVWWWRPLWNYTVSTCRLTNRQATGGSYNDGAVIRKATADRIAATLTKLLDEGLVKKYEEQYEAERKALPQVTCEICKGTGQRDDEYVKGKCNGCDGTGKQENWGTHYPFSEENVREFRDFVRDSGGFRIC